MDGGGDRIAALGEQRALPLRDLGERLQLQLADESLGRDALIKAMVDNPILIERPVVVNGGKYALGRPPENVLEIL